MATIGNVTIRIGANPNQLQSDLKRAERYIKTSAANMQALGERMTLSLSLPIAALGAASLKSAGDIQALQKGLTAVMGSTEAAAAEFDKLREVAKLPGLGLEEAARGSVALQSAGFSADEARRSLLAFGNALATVGKGKNELNFVNLAITQLQNKTGGFGQDLRQLTEQLPQLRGALTNAFGTADSEKIQELGVTGKEVVTAIISEFEKLPKVSGGLNNAFENLSDSIKVSLFQIGTAINEAFGVESILEEIGNKVQQLADWFSKLSPEARKSILVLAGIVAVLGPALIVFSQLYLAIGNVRLAMLGFAKATALASSIGSLVTFFKLATTSAAGFSVAMKVLTASTLSFTKSLLLNPFVLGLSAAAAAVYLIYQNWELVKDVLRAVGNYFIDIYNNSLLLKGAVNFIVFEFKQVWEVLKLIGKGLYNILTFNIEGLKQSFKDFKNNTLTNLKAGIDGTFDPEPLKKFKKESADLFPKGSKFKGFDNVLGGGLPYTPIGILAPTGGTKTTKTPTPKPTKELSEQISDLKKNIDALSIAYAQKPSAGILEKLNDQIAKLKEKESILENSEELVKRLTSGQDGKIELLPKINFSGALNTLKDFAKQSSETIRTETKKGLLDGLKVNYQETGFSTFFKELENDLLNIQRQFDGGVISGLESNIMQFDTLTGRLQKLQKEGFGPMSREVIEVKGLLDEFGGFEGFSNVVQGVDKVNSTLAAATPIVNSLSSLFNTFTNQQLENIDAREKREIESINNSAYSQEEKEKRITAAEKKYDTERKKIQRQQAIAAKLTGIFQATVAMFQGVAQALALGPAGVALVPIMKALGIANIAAIAAAPLPSLAVGTDYVKSDGMAYLHRGEAVVPADVVGGGFSRNMQLFSVIRGNDIYMINERNQALAQRLK